MATDFKTSTLTLAEAISLWAGGRRVEAQRACEALLSGEHEFEARGLLAEIYAASGRAGQERDSLLRLVSLRPQDAAAWRRLGDAWLSAGDAQQAIASYERSLLLEPDNVRAHNNRGQGLLRMGKLQEALHSYQCALQLAPDYAPAHYNSALVLERLERYEQALGSYERVLDIQANSLEALSGSANLLQRLGRYEQALHSYQRALQLAPNQAGVLCNAANALLQLRRYEQALEYCDRALQSEPKLAEAHNNRGGALRGLHRNEEAVQACERALECNPHYAQAMSNLANALLQLKRPQLALEYCDRALQLQPRLAEAMAHRAAALLLSQRHAEAAEAYERVLQINPHHKFVAGAILELCAHSCEWEQHEDRLNRLLTAVAADQPVIHPLMLMALTDDSSALWQATRVYLHEQLQGAHLETPIRTTYQHERIRVAYLSADFHQHATADLAVGLFESHDRGRFEITAVSFGPDDASPMRTRLRSAFDHFIEVRDLSDERVVQRMRQLEIDIAVDLKGYTQDSRPGILARRAAPVQVSYLGYPGTTALDQIDYIVADRIVLPREQWPCYTEKVVYLPESYQVNDSKRPDFTHIPSRTQLGLPEHGFVFCCFNNNYKITPQFFAVWMQILGRVPGSVLWLLEGNSAVAANLRRAAKCLGVEPDRLIFAPRVPTTEHLARHSQADLFLDCLPYGAHTTCSDALWSGLPVLTCLGQTFAGRVAASLLTAVGIPELVASDLHSYVESAVQLAENSQRLQSLRMRLQRNRHICSLFDTDRFCRHLEQAFVQMWQRAERGEDPASFAVEPVSTEAVA